MRRFIKKNFNRFISTLLVIICFSCSNELDNLEGNWAVTEIYHNGRDISQINKSARAKMSNSLIIDKRRFVFKYNNKPKRIIRGKIKKTRVGENIAIELYETTDTVFNGIYDVTIKLDQTNMHRSARKYYLELNSDNLTLYGIKHVIEL